MDGNIYSEGWIKEVLDQAKETIDSWPEEKKRASGLLQPSTVIHLTVSELIFLLKCIEKAGGDELIKIFSDPYPKVVTEKIRSALLYLLDQVEQKGSEKNSPLGE